MIDPSDMVRCDNCGGVFHIDALDAKPPSLKGQAATVEAIIEAADRGEDFTSLECSKCYGPAYRGVE